MSVKRRDRIKVSVAALALPIVLLAAACDRQTPSTDAPSAEVAPVVVQPVDAAPAAEPAPAETPAPRSEPRTPAPARVVPVGANPSFDCARARRNVERMICGDGDLAAADRRLAAAVARAGRYAILRDDLRSGGRAFLTRRDACPDRDCVLDEYSSWTTKVQGMAKEQEMIG